MGFINIGKKTKGKDFNHFQKIAVNWGSFGGGSNDGQGPDVVITFSTQGVIFHTEGTNGTTQVIEYSFNGNTVHGELIPAGNRATLTFNNRKVSLIWFRLKSGSTGPVTCSVEAWSIE